MSKKTSKLSRKCANKHVQPLLDNYMNKSSDDFEDDTKHFTRNTVKNLNKDQQKALSKSVTSSKNKIRSALQEFSVDSSTRKPSNNKENAFSLISHNKISESIKFINGREKTNISSSHDKNPNDCMPLNIDKSDLGRSKHDKKAVTENVEPTSKTKIQNSKNDTILPPCPLCGKEFRSSLEKRTAHLKECGSLLGMRTEDLIKVHRLEEKQAAEWKALDLPNRVLLNLESNKNDTGNTGSSRNVNSDELIMKKARKKKQPDKIIVQSSNDPNLEIALALSASLAQDKPSLSSLDTKPNQDEKLDKQSMANENKTLPTSLCSNKDDQIPDVIMPTASCWWKKTSPVSKKTFMSSKRGCNKRYGKTKLESISDIERSSKISEEVAKILSGSERVCSDVQENISFINENGKDFHFFSSPQRQNLRRQWRNKKVEGLETNQKTFPKTLWEKSQHYNIKDEYYVEAFIKYKLEPKEHQINSLKTECRQETKIKDSCIFKSKNTSYSSITKVCQDFEAILENGSRSDITIYSKNEEPLKCHSLILYTRCKKVLEDVVSQKTISGDVEAMLCWNSYDYCVVKSIIRYLYCGKLPCDIRDGKEWKQHKTLSDSYGISEYSKYIEEYNKSTFLAEAANDISSNDKHDTTGGFLENSNLVTENDQDFDENKEGTTQNLDLLLSEFDANGSANNSKEANDFQSVKQIKGADLSPGDSDEEWNDVHEHLTQKPDQSLPLHAKTSLDLTAGELKLPEDVQFNLSDIRHTNEQSQASRSDSPDMFADEDENNFENDHTSTPLKHSKSFIERFEDVPTSSMTHNKDEKSKESLLSHNPLNSPITPMLCNSINIKENLSNQPYEVLSKANTESTTQESSNVENLEDNEIPKLSTPIEFSDNESFNDIYLETEGNHSLVEPPEKSNCDDADSSKCALIHSVQVNNEKKDDTSCRISSIRSKLKSVDATNFKTIEILLQELLTICDITIETLVQTGIGKTVKELAETCISETVKRKARLLVSRWTLLVNQHVETQEKEIQITHDVLRTPSRINNDTQMVTPRPEYEVMITPAIRDELKKYGIRDMSKAKAIPLLDHIYKETHPIMEFRTGKKDGIMNLDQSFDTISNSSNNSEDHELMEESIMLNNQYDILSQDQSQPRDISPEVNLRELILKYIQSDKDLYNKCLMYEPFWLEQFFKDFKPFALAHNLTAKQINLKLVTDILDNECLTFRTGASANRNRVPGKKSAKSKNNSSSCTSQRRKGKKRLSSSQTVIAPTKKRGRKNVYATQS